MAGNTNTTFVVDASFALCFLLPDEHKEYVVEKFGEFITGKTIFITTFIFKFEVTNSLIIAYRRKRISLKSLNSLTQAFMKLRIPSENTDIQAVTEVALKYNLTAYDASYVVLSHQLNAPLLTLDKKLKRIRE